MGYNTNMLLIVHIIFALGSIILMAGAVAGRLRDRSADFRGVVRASCVGFCGLIATGFSMVIFNGASLMSTCTSGLVWLAVLTAMYALYAKLAVPEL
jgi:hypothetical protein